MRLLKTNGTRIFADLTDFRGFFRALLKANGTRIVWIVNCVDFMNLRQIESAKIRQIRENPRSMPLKKSAC
ncbi:MAG: hypothetical protein FWG87_05810 [Defluviitaleaceae bacterium]|nr:hypothetical protein [Defluviitaleaceae bacterium]